MRKRVLSFLFHCNKGVDDGVDLDFKVNINTGTTYHWSFKSDVVSCFQLQVAGLTPGENRIYFETTKAGTVTEPNPNEYLGGKGIVKFDQVCLIHHRDVAL